LTVGLMGGCGCLGAWRRVGDAARHAKAWAATALTVVGKGVSCACERCPATHDTGVRERDDRGTLLGVDDRRERAAASTAE
jgi:hypothetical protein